MKINPTLHSRSEELSWSNHGLFVNGLFIWGRNEFGNWSVDFGESIWKNENRFICYYRETVNIVVFNRVMTKRCSLITSMQVNP